jgi:hypothetical protein
MPEQALLRHFPIVRILEQALLRRLPIMPTPEQALLRHLPIMPMVEQALLRHLPIVPTLEQPLLRDLPIVPTPEQASLRRLPIAPTAAHRPNWRSSATHRHHRKPFFLRCTLQLKPKALGVLRSFAAFERRKQHSVDRLTGGHAKKL